MTQWEKFRCKRSYSERRKNRPSGSNPTASKTSPPVPPASVEARPPSSLPLPPPSEGRGVVGEALGVAHACTRASSSPSSCARSREETGGREWCCGWDWACLSWSRGEGGGDQVRFPLPSHLQCSLALLPCPVRLSCWCATLGHVHAARGLCREHPRSRSRAACGERYRDRSRSVGSRVRTRVSRPRSTGRSRSRGRNRSRRSSSRSPSVRARSCQHRSRSSDRNRCREVRLHSRAFPLLWPSSVPT